MIHKKKNNNNQGVFLELLVAAKKIAYLPQITNVPNIIIAY